jgi:hypothetical protein
MSTHSERIKALGVEFDSLAGRLAGLPAPTLDERTLLLQQMISLLHEMHVVTALNDASSNPHMLNDSEVSPSLI